MGAAEVRSSPSENSFFIQKVISSEYKFTQFIFDFTVVTAAENVSFSLGQGDEFELSCCN